MQTLPASDPRAVAYVDLDAMTVILNSGEKLAITNLFDEDGDACEPSEAATCVAGNDMAGWWAVDVRELVSPQRLN